MRTTIELPDELMREVKVTAARRGTSLKLFIRGAVETELHKTDSKAARRVKFPLLTSSEPGTLDLSNAEIEDFLA